MFIELPDQQISIKDIEVGQCFVTNTNEVGMKVSPQYFARISYSDNLVRYPYVKLGTVSSQSFTDAGTGYLLGATESFKVRPLEDPRMVAKL